MAKGGYQPPLAPGDPPQLNIQLTVTGEDPTPHIELAQQYIDTLPGPSANFDASQPSSVPADGAPPAPIAIIGGVAVGGLAVPAGGPLVINVIPPNS